MGRLAVATFFAKLRPVVMGPGFRQDDTGFAVELSVKQSG
jgi:hypothetical protein